MEVVLGEQSPRPAEAVQIVPVHKATPTNQGKRDFARKAAILDVRNQAQTEQTPYERVPSMVAKIPGGQDQGQKEKILALQSHVERLRTRGVQSPEQTRADPNMHEITIASSTQSAPCQEGTAKTQAMHSLARESNFLNGQSPELARALQHEQLQRQMA